MFSHFCGQTADELWASVASTFRAGAADGTLPSRTGRGGPTYEILHAALTLRSPRQRWVATRSPAINIAFAIAECVWILAGRRDAAFVGFFNRSLSKYVGEGRQQHGAYGYRLRKRIGVDQLNRAFRVLKSNPTSRQVVLQIWDGRIDLPRPSGHPASPDIPCNLVSCVKIQDGKLHWLQVLRSNDAFLGLPYNVVQFTTLQEVMAGWLGVDVGDYDQVSDSLHIYERDLEHLTSAGTSSLANADTLALPFRESVRSWTELERRVIGLVRGDVPPESLVASVRRSALQPGYRSMLSILAAEYARRCGCRDEAEAILQECSNPLYTFMYRRWQDRVAEAKHSRPSGST